VDTIFVGFC